MNPRNPKKEAALKALDELPNEGVIGLGTGSTARFFIEAIADLVRSGRRFACVPTSEASRLLAVELGIPLLSDIGPWDVDLTVDGADEVDEALNLIKGGGGAHTREKIVNFASRRNVIIVDESKLSSKLGIRWPVPLEVIPFAHEATAALITKRGLGSAKPVLRIRDGKPIHTDSGNLIYDLPVEPIANPKDLDTALHAIPGIVETGLFVGRADIVIVAGAETRILKRTS